MQYIIDRIEENTAVCEAPDKTQILLPLSALPAGIQEGDVVTGEAEMFSVDLSATEDRKKQIREKMKNLFQ